MPVLTSREELHVLRNILDEAHTILTTIQLPQGRAQRAAELLDSALSITDNLIKSKPAAELGSKGGLRTAERGSEYFKRIAAMRKTRAGGRPKKKA